MCFWGSQSSSETSGTAVAEVNLHRVKNFSQVPEMASPDSLDFLAAVCHSGQGAEGTEACPARSVWSLLAPSGL